jgi:hypothetical protein
MSESDEVNSNGKKHRSWSKYASIIISAIALFVSLWVAYRNVLKPFELAIHINPTLQVQHKINLGLYLTADFFNNSPSNGQITQLGIVLYKVGSEEDKYLLTLLGFRVIGTDGNYTASDEELPLFFQPWQRQNRTMNFIYLVQDEEFPLSSGTYVGELLMWTDYDKKPNYISRFKFDITGDVLKAYLDRKQWGSTTLEPLSMVGYTPIKSRKLALEDYNLLH